MEKYHEKLTKSQKKKELRSFKKLQSFYFWTNFHEKGLKMLEMTMVPIVTYVEMKKNYRKFLKIQKLNWGSCKIRKLPCFKNLQNSQNVSNSDKQGLKMTGLFMFTNVIYLEMMKIANNKLIRAIIDEIGRKTMRQLFNAYVCVYTCLSQHVLNTPN